VVDPAAEGLFFDLDFTNFSCVIAGHRTHQDFWLTATQPIDAMDVSAK
jgi:hypothetical protein